MRPIIIYIRRRLAVVVVVIVDEIKAEDSNLLSSID